MTWTENIDDWKQTWEETLAPETPLEQRLVKFIARQDYLLDRSIFHTLSAEDERRALECSNIQRNLADSMDCLIQALTVIQQRRIEAKRPAPPTAAAKVVKLPNRSPAGLGRYQRFKPLSESLPGLEPFGTTRSDSRESKRGSQPKLEVKLAA